MTRFTRKYRARRQAGLCVDCGQQPHASGCVQCAGCIERRRTREAAARRRLEQLADATREQPSYEPPARPTRVFRGVEFVVTWDGR